MSDHPDPATLPPMTTPTDADRCTSCGEPVGADCLDDDGLCDDCAEEECERCGASGSSVIGGLCDDCDEEECIDDESADADDLDDEDDEDDEWDDDEWIEDDDDEE